MNKNTLVKGVVAWLLCSLCFSLLATSKTGPRVGDKPPLLRVTTLLQAPPGAKLDAEALRGKVVVLEFWATWCGPCVAAIRHLNELAAKFADQPVCFIAITAEKATTIEPFLKKRPMKAWIGLDTDNAMNKAYGIERIPHTVLLGKDGLIAGITHPEAITEQHIRDLLEGKSIALAAPGSGDQITAGIDPDDKSVAEPLFEVLVRPSNSTNMAGVGGGGRFTARGYTIRDILPRAFGQSAVYIQTSDPLPEGRYDFIVAQKPVTGESPSALDEKVSGLLQQALQSAFGLSGKKETKEIEVMLLKVKEPNARGLVVSPTPLGASQVGPGVVEGSIANVVMALERTLNKPVFDETGFTNQYEISLRWEQKAWDKSNPDGLLKVVREQLGLEVLPAKRSIEVVVIEQVKKPAKKGD